MKNIVIIWWTDWFWRWLAKYILDNLGSDINLTITWRNKDKAETYANELNCKYSLDNTSAVKNADVIIFAVPIAYMIDTIKELAPNAKSGSVILDVTSIKKGPSQAMKDFAWEWVLVIPTHPMFGPYISTIAWQIFVLTPEDIVKKDTRYTSLKTFLVKAWAKVIEATPKEHDKMMAIVQWLTHFDMFVLWETIKRLWVDIQKSMNFVSPIYKIMISSVSRYMNQSPKLYWDIQMFNDEVLEVHKVFMEATDDFNKFVREKDEKKFINTILHTQEYFWDNAIKWQQYTDKIIYMLSRQVEKLEKNIWKVIIITNIYTKEQKKSELVKFKDDTIYLKSWEKLSIDEWEIN